MNGYSGKTVLVTGATGLLGSHIVDVLMSQQKVRVIALSRTKEKLEKGFSKYIELKNFKIIAQDITEPLKIDEQIDYIFHAAGPMEGNVIKNRPIDVIMPNIVGTINCLEFLRRQKDDLNLSGRLILFSSVTVYANNSNTDAVVSENDTSLTENLDSVSAPYSQSKRLSEVIVKAYIKQYGIDAVIGRFSTVYGATRFAPDTAFYEFIYKAMIGENIQLNTLGLPRRDNIYVDDAIDAVLCIGMKGICGEAYNISSNGELGNYSSVDEIAQIIVDVKNSKDIRGRIKVEFKDEKKKGRKVGLKLDNSKLKNLGWDISISLREGINRTFEKMKEYNYRI